MRKVDLVKEDKAYYNADKYVIMCRYGNIPYLTIIGKGEPAGKEFTEKAGAIYPVAYGVKKICKEKLQDFAVPKLEGLWWVDDQRPALEVSKSEWHWKLLIRMPDFVNSAMVEKAVSEVVKKKTKTASDVKFEIIDEGDLVSILHIGPYKTEPESIKRMEDFTKGKGLAKNGPHHEIYLSDPNKTEPEKLRTILRQPVKKLL